MCARVLVWDVTEAEPERAEPKLTSGNGTDATASASALAELACRGAVLPGASSGGVPPRGANPPRGGGAW